MQIPDFQNFAFTDVAHLLTGVERKGGFALSVHFAVTGVSASKLAADQ